MASSLRVRPVKRPAVKMPVRRQTTSLREAKSEGESLAGYRRDGPRPRAVANLMCVCVLLTSYVAALELRIEKLERRIAYAKSRKASVALHDSEPLSTAHVDRRDSLASIRAAIHRKAARTRENSDVNSLISDFGFL